jgi:hypothetical protein
MVMKEFELVHQDEYVSLYWSAADVCIVLEAKGDPSSDQYRQIMERVLQLVVEKGARKLLADTARVSSISNDDLMWTELDWSPRLRNTSVKFVAIVMPKSLTLHMSLDQLTQRAEVGPTGQVRKLFADLEAARKWMIEQ